MSAATSTPLLRVIDVACDIQPSRDPYVSKEDGQRVSEEREALTKRIRESVRRLKVERYKEYKAPTWASENERKIAIRAVNVHLRGPSAEELAESKETRRVLSSAAERNLKRPKTRTRRWYSLARLLYAIEQSRNAIYDEKSWCSEFASSMRLVQPYLVGFTNACVSEVSSERDAWWTVLALYLTPEEADRDDGKSERVPLLRWDLYHLAVEVLKILEHPPLPAPLSRPNPDGIQKLIENPSSEDDFASGQGPLPRRKNS